MAAAIRFADDKEFEELRLKLDKKNVTYDAAREMLRSDTVKNGVGTPVNVLIDTADMAEERLLLLNDNDGGYMNSFESFVPAKDWLNDRWLSTGSSVNGIVIGHCLIYLEFSLPVIVRGFLFCMQHFVIISVAQCTMLYYIYSALQSLKESDFCGVSSDAPLYLSIAFVFITSLVPSLIGIINEMKIVCSATVYYRFDPTTGRSTVQRLLRTKFGIIMAICVVIYELLFSVAVLLVGLGYIITASGASNVIQTAVGITFVQDLSTMALFFYEKEAELCKYGRYRRTEGAFYRKPHKYVNMAVRRLVNSMTTTSILLVIAVVSCCFIVKRVRC